MSTAQFKTSVLDPASFLTIYNSLSGILADLPLIGSLFKGKTQHVDYDTCVAKSNEIATASMRFYLALDTEGRHLMYTKAREYYISYVLAGFGAWWDNAIQKDYASWGAKGWTANEQELTYHYLAQPVFYFMFFPDATNFQELFPDRYTNKLNVVLWTPLSEYVKQKFGTSLDAIVKQNISDSASTSPSTKTWIVVGVLAAAAFGYFIYKKKG
jgi:hypothetical protein